MVYNVECCCGSVTFVVLDDSVGLGVVGKQGMVAAAAAALFSSSVAHEEDTKGNKET